MLIFDERNLRYASGFAFTDGAMLVGKTAAVLITDSRYIEAAEKSVDKSIRLRLFGAGARLTDVIKSELGNLGVKKLGAEEESLSYVRYRQLEKSLECNRLKPCQKLFSELRAAKSTQEQELMRKAQRISELALLDVLPIIKPGVSEKDIAAELSYRMRKHGGEGDSFEPIALCGANTSMPHGVPSEAVVKNGDFVTMDFGCLYGGYCSDMTRTLAVGYATDEMKNVYDIVLRAQTAGIKAARAGISGHDIDAAARSVIEKAGYGEYFGHSFGHSLGLYIHESPSASPKESAIMPCGAVISAEPGIYIPQKFGVRIEDVLILNETGCENITKAEKSLIIL